MVILKRVRDIDWVKWEKVAKSWHHRKNDVPITCGKCLHRTDD